MRRTLTIAALGTLLCLVAAGCDLNVKDVTPKGTGPLRYRDAIFTDVTTTSDITYGSAPKFDGSGTEVLKLDVYRPTGDTVKKRPLVVYVHGGSFKNGDKTSPELVDEANTLAKEGYVVASIDYRMDPVGCTAYGDACLNAIRGAMHDAQAAVRYLRNKDNTYGIDASRIAMGGSSAGAITAVNVAWAGKDVGSSGTPGVSSAIKGAVSLSGAAILTTPAKGAPPVLFLHGTADHTVPYDWMVASRKNADKVGVHTELTAWDGDGHVPYVAHRQQILDETRNFLYAELDLAHAAH